MKTIKIPMNAGRVADAIARIGYEPHAALMDLIDNSIAAKATKICVSVNIDEDKTYAQKNNVIRYLIVDNGIGMNEEGIIKAFQLGSDVEYGPASPSKYGMGLKSAGLSLGSKIHVISKQNDSISDLYCLDKAILSEKGYCITKSPIPEDKKQEYEQLLSSSSSGTIIEILRTNEIYHSSARATLEKLIQKAGVVYYPFLVQNNLEITIRCSGRDDTTISPFDILFIDKAKTDFDKDTYDCVSPYNVFSEELQLTDVKTETPMKLEIVVFPMAKMASHPELSEDQRSLVRSYKINKNNKGFFIYRNDRLIRWGDDLDGLVGRDLLGFRAKLTINSSHDDILHVDVSKQRLSIPEDIINRIESIIRIPLKQSTEAFNCCKLKLNTIEGEGKGFNFSNQELYELDPDEEFLPPDKKTQQKERKENISKKTEDKKDNYEDDDFEPPNDDDSTINEPPVFKKVRYSDKVQSAIFWESEHDKIDGTYVRLNRNHAFYITILQELGESEATRLALEAIFWSLGVSENKTIQNLLDYDQETITAVLDKFKRVFSTNLDSWCTNNQNIFNRD